VVGWSRCQANYNSTSCSLPSVRPLKSAAVRRVDRAARCSVRSTPDFLRLGSARVARVSIAELRFALAGVADLACVAVVLVDATEYAARDRDDIVEDDIAWPAVALAIAARAHQLAVITREEVFYANRAATVELDDLVVSAESSAADYIRRAVRLLESQGVLADVRPPNVDEGAVASTRASSASVCGKYSELHGERQRELTRDLGNALLRLARRR